MPQPGGGGAFAPVGLGLWAAGPHHDFWRLYSGVECGANLPHLAKLYRRSSFLPSEGQCYEVSRTTLAYWLDRQMRKFIYPSASAAMIAAGFVIFAVIRTLMPGRGRKSASKRAAHHCLSRHCLGWGAGHCWGFIWWAVMALGWRIVPITWVARQPLYPGGAEFGVATAFRSLTMMDQRKINQQRRPAQKLVSRLCR